MVDGPARHVITAVVSPRPGTREIVLVARDSPPLGSTVSVGRQGDLSFQAEPVDEGVSRRALSITSAAHGWLLEFTNRNGTELRPWAQAAEWPAYGEKRLVRWPRVGVRILGFDTDREWWVLLEADDLTSSYKGEADERTVETKVETPPRALTIPQMAAVQAIFADHFAWPPCAQPQERSLEAAGARLSVGPSAIRERLVPVQDRARRLGFRSEVGITDPTYIFHLVRHGYISSLPTPV